MTEIKKFYVTIDGDVTRVAGQMVYPRAVDSGPEQARPAAPDFDWEMPTSDLSALGVLITMPGRLRGIRVTGSIDPGGVGRPIGAVRTRILPVWGRSTANLPSCRLLLEAVGANPSDDDLRDGYSTTLLDVGPEGWRHLRNVVGEASAAAKRDDSDFVTHWDNL